MIHQYLKNNLCHDIWATLILPVQFEIKQTCEIKSSGLDQNNRVEQI